MTLTPSSPDRALGDFVNEDVRSATVFERFGFDYCCRGQQTLAEAARKGGVPVNAVIEALTELGDSTLNTGIPAAWNDLAVLTRHIVERHHHYVRTTIPLLDAQFDRLVQRHGARHPELIQAQEAFKQLAEELLPHLEKEERLLFPHIDEMAEARRTGQPLPRGPFATAWHPIQVMESDHVLAGDLMERLRRLTSDFTPPADACATYRACFGELAHFESDLHRHIHLENNVLFPRALELERALM